MGDPGLVFLLELWDGVQYKQEIPSLNFFVHLEQLCIVLHDIQILHQLHLGQTINTEIVQKIPENRFANDGIFVSLCLLLHSIPLNPHSENEVLPIIM